MKVGDEVRYLGRQWTITSIWDTHTEGLRANLVRKDKTKKRGIDRCAAQIKDLRSKQR
jgi:hypothetical protein